MRILIADDEPDIVRLLQALLPEADEVDQAGSGVRVVELVRKAVERGKPYDLLCLDIMMPEMDGREALRAVRAMETEKGIDSDQRIKTVMITALDDSENVYGSLLEDGADAYIVKPLRRNNLRTVLREMGLPLSV